MFRRVHVTTAAGKLRHTARGPAGSARTLLLAMALGVSLLAAACGGGGGGSSNPPPPPPPPSADPPVVSGNVQLVSPSAIVTSPAGTTNLVVDLSLSTPVSIGIILLGTDTNLKLVDHGQLLTTNGVTFPFFITGPAGIVPLSFNQIDWCDTAMPPNCDSVNLQFKDGIEDDFPDSLIDRQVEALFFPNDGSNPGLPAGTYTFPVGAADAFGFLTTDTLTPYVLVKNSVPAGQTMRINIFVASGVGPGITDAASAEADAEIAGAIQFLRDVYETKVGLVLDVNVDVVPNSFVTINSASEQEQLLSTYPLTLTSDRLNLFVIGSLAYLFGGVIGLSADLPGAFNFHGTILSGTLAEYQGDGTGNELGFILAHEFGHYLGLYHTSQTFNSDSEIVGHDPITDTLECTTADLAMGGGIDNCPDRNNLMFPTILLDVNLIEVETGQTTVIELNPAIFSPP